MGAFLQRLGVDAGADVPQHDHALALQLDRRHRVGDERVGRDVGLGRRVAVLGEGPQATAAAQLAIEFNGWLERLFVLPQPNLPPPRTSPGSTRAAWRLDDGPAPNMVQLLESRGVRVFSLPVDCAAQEAFSCWHNGTPFVFLNPAATPEQARFDATRQLAVLLGHDEPVEFAAEFLMPEKQFYGMSYRRWLARYYGMLIPADASVLEVGCGGGELLAMLPNRDVMGVDLSGKQIEAARQRVPHGRFEIQAGESLRLVVMERVPWPRPTVLHAARRLAAGGGAYDDRVVRARLAQAFGRLIRRQGDKGLFVILSSALPSRLLTAFPPEVAVSRVPLDVALQRVRTKLFGSVGVGQPENVT